MRPEDTENCGEVTPKGFSEDPSWPDVSQWLEKHRYQILSSVKNPNLQDILSAIFTERAKEVKPFVESFIRNVIFSFETMKKLYSAELIDMLVANEHDVWELLSDNQLSRFDISFFIISTLVKTNICLISFHENEPELHFYGKSSLPSKVFLVKFKNVLIVVKKAPSLTEGNSFSSSFSRSIIMEPKMVSSNIDLFDKSSLVKPKLIKSNIDIFEKTSVIESTSSDSWKDSNYSDCSTFLTTEKPQSSDTNIEASRGKSKSYSSFAQKQHQSASLKEIRSNHVSPKEGKVLKKGKLEALSTNPLIGSVTQSSQPGSSQSLIREQFRPNILVEEVDYRWGKMKFYSHKKEFGFVLSQRKEYFVQRDDLMKSGINVEDPNVRNSLTKAQVKFRLMKYKGNHKEALKAFDIKLV